MLLQMGVRSVNDVQKQVGKFQFLQRRPESVHQMVGQFCDKSYGVGKDHVQIVGNRQKPGGGIQRVKQPVVGGDSRAGELIEQGGFSRVGVAHNGHHRNGIFHSPLPLDGAHLAHLLQLFFQTVDALPDMPPVRFQLRLAGATGADTAALPGKARAHAGQSGQQIFILRQLHLKPAFLRLRPLGENVQNQGASVQNGKPDNFLQRPDVAGRKLVVENDHGGLGRFRQHPHLLRFSLADEAVGIGGMAVLQHLARAEAPCGLQEVFQLVQCAFGGGIFLSKAVRIQSHQNRPFLGLFIKSFFHVTSVFLMGNPGFSSGGTSPHTISSIIPHIRAANNHKNTKIPHCITQCGICGSYFRPNRLLNRSTRPPVSTSFCLPV